MASMDFRSSVLRIVRVIPKGKTLSYGEVARQAGFPGAARAAGTVLKGNFDPAIPCHRVIRANGTPGEYNRGERLKYELLRKEGAML